MTSSERLSARIETAAGAIAYVGGLIGGVALVLHEASEYLQVATTNTLTKSMEYSNHIDVSSVITISAAALTTVVGGAVMIDGLRKSSESELNPQ